MRKIIGSQYGKLALILSLGIIYFTVIALPLDASAMHIMEGYLPAPWAIGWFIAFIPFFIVGIKRMKSLVKEDKNNKLLLALCGAFIFVLSALKIPSVTGSCSHPTGVGLATALFGPFVVSVLGVIVLLFQALLLAHGGLTTLGANAISMAVIGPIVGYLAFKLARKYFGKGISIFVCAFVADITTYIVTSVQLGIVFVDPSGGVAASIMKFMGIFAVTQIPIAIAEGLLTIVMFNLVSKNLPDKVAALR